MTITDSALNVRTEHLDGEMLLVDLGHAAIVSDHPESMGGTGKGPTPGEFIKGSLAASAAIAVGQAIERQALAVRSFSVACSTGIETRRRPDGPLTSTTTLSDFQVHVALIGSLDEAQLAAVEEAVRTCPVATALSAGVEIEERDVFLPRSADRPARATTHLIESMRKARPTSDEPVVLPPNLQTQVTADYLGNGRVLVTWARATYVVGASPSVAGREVQASPEALLLAGLSACTSVFVARAAADTKADAEVRVHSCGTIDAATGAMQIVKTLEVTGDVTAEQQETMTIFGDNCAIGETLRKRAQISIHLRQVPSGEEAAQSSSAGALGADAQALADQFADIECDDGSCCVPDLQAMAQAKTGG